MTAISFAQAKQASPSPPPPPAKRPRVNVDLAKFERADAAALAKQATVGGATRGSGDRFPQPLAPMSAKSYTTTPVFAWTYPGPTRKFVFTLNDADGNELLRESVNGYEYRALASAGLAPGKRYTWTVQPESATSGPPSPELTMEIVGGTERKNLEAALANAGGDDTRRLQALVDAGVWYDTVAALNEMIAAHPGDADLLELRGHVFEKSENTRSAAQRDLQRAGELRK
ncbi:MAG TPA: DUF928 domain-containing protein [Terriglobales bacterium]|nr:DUF928 domain-containing protein [Terriglobales bacterium]